MATRLPTAVKNTMLKAGFSTATTWHWGLCTTTPGTTGAHECTGGSYARQTSKVTAAATAKSHNASKMTFTGMPTCTVKDFLINATASGTGTYKGGGALTSSLTVPAGSTVTVAIGGFTLSVTG